MGLIQVVSLMVNQMIGSGVFSTPGVVLLLTGTKYTSLVLWALGGVYTFLR
jgi:amino acid transporter